MTNHTVSAYKKRLWKYFAAYIKKRDKNICVTCGKYAEGQAMSAGHYIAKAACGLEYYFHEQNVHAQCSTCNLKLEGNRPAYREFLLKKYGKEVLQDLETNYHKPHQGDSKEWLLEKIEHYKNL